MNRGGPLERRAGLGRGPGPSRRTGLNPGKGLSRGKPLERRAPITGGHPIAARPPAPRGEPGPPRKKPAAAPDIPERVRKLVYRRDNDTCARCGRPALQGNRQVQHRCPRGMGGRGRNVDAHRLSVLVLMCGTSATDPNGCHQWAESEVTEAKAAGFRVKPGLDPSTVPVHWFDGERYYLRDDGSRVRVGPEDVPG